ncbi:MAG: 1-acyl-sn-glycerol-3-phosphate acyltransferase [Chitinophagales bacterium]
MEFNFLYWLFKPLIQTSWRTAYKIRLIGRQNIDYSKPTLIVANHTNAVIDPVAIAAFSRRGIYFLARGDAFKNGFFKWLLWQFHIIPIFRKEEAENNLEKNKETFVRMFDMFDQNKSIIIFSEGKCIQEKRVREFKKGTAHIMVDYAVKTGNTSRLQILPVGLNYYKHNQFRSDLLMNFGKPFTIDDVGVSDLSAKEAINQITQFAHASIIEVAVSHQHEALLGLEIPIEEMIGKSLIKKQKNVGKKRAMFQMHKEVVDTLNIKYNEDRQSVLNFKKDINLLEEKLEQHNIPISALKNQNKVVPFFKSIGLLLTLPFFLLGFILNAIPFFLPMYIVNSKVKNVVFKSTVRVVLGMFLFFIFYLLYFLLVPKFVFGVNGFLNRFFNGIIVIVLSHWLLLFSYFWYKQVKKITGTVRCYLLQHAEKQNIELLYVKCKNWLKTTYNL